TATLDMFTPGAPSPRSFTAAGDLRLQHDRVARVLLDDRKQPGVEEADLEQYEERQRAVDLIRERVEHRPREVEAERELDERLNRDRLTVLLAHPLVGVGLDAVLRRARELAFLAEERFEHRARVVDRQADADRHQERDIFDSRPPVLVNLALAHRVEVAERERRREEQGDV